MLPNEMNLYAKERINEMIKAREEHDRWRRLAPKESVSPLARLSAWWRGLIATKSQRRLKRSR